MMPMSNVCEQCGGQKTVYYRIEPVYGNNYTPAVHALTPSTMKLCLCPIPRAKHDGKLKPMGDEVYTAMVQYFDDNPASALLALGGGYSVDRLDDGTVYIDPKQALSLLDWLTQERTILEGMVSDENT